MVFFGVQGLEAYIIIGWSAQYLRDAGLTAAAAGLLLGLNQVIGIPLSALVPALTVRPRAAAAAAARASWPATRSGGSGSGSPRAPPRGCG